MSTAMNRRPEFFKVFVPGHSSKQLKIPLKFVQHLGGRTSGSVVLTGPSGNTWKTNLMKKKNGLFFDQGWQTFVKDHLINLGEFLVFRYDGILKFSVTIYDHSACQKEMALYAKCSQPADNITKDGKKRAREKEATSSLALLGDSPKRMKGCSETVEQRAAKSFPTKHPFFVIHVQKSNLCSRRTRTGSLHVPNKFVKEHLLSYQNNEKMVLRNQKGESWMVNILIGRRSYRSFSGGWICFARNNNIRVRDTCKFELVDKFEMHVHIIRHEKQKSNQAEKNRFKLETISSQPADNITKDGKKRAREKAATSSLDLLGDSTKRMKVLSTKRGCSETVEQHAAKSFPPKRPFFVIRNQKYNLHYGKLHVPTKFVKEHLLSYQSKEKMVLRNQKGESWSVNMIISRQSYCCFSAGWNSFRNSNIKMKDTCIFELVDKYEMHVHTIRPEKMKSNKRKVKHWFK